MAPTAKPGNRTRLQGIEGLRGIAACSVLVGHTIALNASPAFGALGAVGALGVILLNGVTLFFVLSGFLLYLPFAQATARGTAVNVRTFYRNRLLRIFPAHTVVLLFTGLVLGAAVSLPNDPGQPREFLDRTGFLTDPLLLISNLALIQGYFPRGIGTGLGVSWSLVPELAFYAVLPGLWLLGRRVSRAWPGKAGVFAPALALLIGGALGRFTVCTAIASGRLGLDEMSATWWSVLRTSLLVQGDLFGLGMLVAACVVAIGGSQRDRQVARILRRACWAVGFVALLAVPFGRPWNLDTPLLGTVCAAALLWLVLPHGGRTTGAARAVLETAALRHLGEISFSIYLWHFPVIVVFQQHSGLLEYSTFAELAASIAMVAVATGVLAELTYRLVERPFLVRKRSITLPAAAGV